MIVKRLVWIDGRFSWWFVATCVASTLLLLGFDYYWRTHDTSFASYW